MPNHSIATRTPIIILASALLFGGCAQDSDESSDDPIDGKADTWGEEGAEGVIIDSSGDGQTFTVVEGQFVVVRLPSNPSTGYDWEVISTDRTFGYPQSTDFVIDDSAPTGSGGLTELAWATSGMFSMIGSHTVVLGYKRSWEEGEPEETFTFTVDIVTSDIPECFPVMCELYCEYGFEVNEDGCEVCRCAEAPECEPVMCEMYCEYGFDVDENGCEVCACADAPECEPVMCDLYCEYGFDVDENGCEICACAP